MSRASSFPRQVITAPSLKKSLWCDQAKRAERMKKRQSRSWSTAFNHGDHSCGNDLHAAIIGFWWDLRPPEPSSDSHSNSNLEFAFLWLMDAIPNSVAHPAYKTSVPRFKLFPTESSASLHSPTLHFAALYSTKPSSVAFRLSCFSASTAHLPSRPDPTPPFRTLSSLAPRKAASQLSIVDTIDSLPFNQLPRAFHFAQASGALLRLSPAAHPSASF